MRAVVPTRLYGRSVPGWVSDVADIIVTIAILIAVLTAAGLIWQNHKRADEARDLARRLEVNTHRANVLMCRNLNELRRQAYIVVIDAGVKPSVARRLLTTENCEALP